jgi:predicted RecA/RadA family phage recombinase
MKNWIQNGAQLTIAAAPYAVTAGQGLQMGGVFGVAVGSAAVSAEVEISTSGVYALTKQAAQAWTQGQALYWDNAGRQVTTTVGTNKLIGYAATAQLAADTVGRVWLPGM